MRTLCSDEIVASVVSRSDDQVVRCYCFECSFQNTGRQMWAIAVEGNYASGTMRREVCKHRSEACGKTFAFLRNYACSVTCQLGEFAYVRVRTHDRDFDISQGSSQRQCVVEKTAIKIGDSLRSKVWREPGLDCPQPRRFRHDDQNTVDI